MDKSYQSVHIYEKLEGDNSDSSAYAYPLARTGAVNLESALEGGDYGAASREIHGSANKTASNRVIFYHFNG